MNVVTFNITLLSICCLFSCSYKKDLNGLVAVEQEIKTKTDINIEYCDLEDENTVNELVYIFIVDNSKSNVIRSSTGHPGTDPTNLRLTEIKKFVEAQPDPPIDPDTGEELPPNIHYAIMPFGTDTLRECYQVFENNTKTLTGDKQEVYDFINFMTSGDGPSVNVSSPLCTTATNYELALAAATKLKQEYFSLMAQKYPSSQTGSQANLIVKGVFISDGVPKILDPNDNIIVQDSETILQLVLNFMKTRVTVGGQDIYEAARVSNVLSFMDTFYYTRAPYSTAPIELLEAMARDGKGKMTKFWNEQLNEPYDITYDSVSMPDLINSFTMETPVVINRSGVWVESAGVGAFMQDSDGDLIADWEEELYGSDPFNEDTDGDGIRDGIEMRFSPNGSPVSTFSIPSVPVSKYKQDQDLDGLYYPEEIAFGTSDLVTDSNSDGLPDFANVYYNLDPTTLDSNADTDGDGFNNMWEINRNLPPNIKNDILKLSEKDDESEEEFQSFELIDLGSEEIPIADRRPGCTRMEIKNFFIADKEQPFNVFTNILSRQTTGKTKLMFTIEKELQTGITNTLTNEEVLLAPRYYEVDNN